MIKYRYFTILLLLLIFASCTHIVTGRSSCLYLQDLRDNPNGFLKRQFSLDKDKEHQDSCSNCHTVKITNDIDWWGAEFYSKDTIPDSYFLINPREREKYEKEIGFHNSGRWIGSGRGNILRIDILKNDNTIAVKSIDFNEYTWGSRNIYFKSISDGFVPIRIITSFDTFHTVIKIQNGKLELERDCIRDKMKRKKGVDLNPLNWPMMLIIHFKKTKANKSINNKGQSNLIDNEINKNGGRRKSGKHTANNIGLGAAGAKPPLD